MLGRTAAGVAVAVGAGEGPEGDVSPEPPQARAQRAGQEREHETLLKMHRADRSAIDAALTSVLPALPHRLAAPLPRAD